jgi:hypothetical protein
MEQLEKQHCESRAEAENQKVKYKIPEPAVPEAYRRAEGPTANRRHFDVLNGQALFNK